MNPIPAEGRYGRLTVLGVAENIGRRRAFHCLCDCGKSLIVIVDSLRTGNTKSCGCLKLKDSLSRPKKEKKPNPVVKTHGLSRSKMYLHWLDIKERCYQPSSSQYARYGGRGITMCDRWKHSFEAFLADMGERPDNLSIDRIDNDGPYSPENCRWATTKQQANNRRSNRRLAFGGVSLTVSEWADVLCIDKNVLYLRLRNSWSVEETLTIPVGGRRKRSPTRKRQFSQGAINESRQCQ